MLELPPAPDEFVLSGAAAESFTRCNFPALLGFYRTPKFVNVEYPAFMVVVLDVVACFD